MAGFCRVLLCIDAGRHWRPWILLCCPVGICWYWFTLYVPQSDEVLLLAVVRSMASEFDQCVSFVSLFCLGQENKKLQCLKNTCKEQSIRLRARLPSPQLLHPAPLALTWSYKHSLDLISHCDLEPVSRCFQVQLSQFKGWHNEHSKKALRVDLRLQRDVSACS